MSMKITQEFIEDEVVKPLMERLDEIEKLIKRS